MDEGYDEGYLVNPQEVARPADQLLSAVGRV
jgi:hypothetical protein